MPRKGMTRKQAKRTAKTGGYKLKTARRLTESQSERTAFYAPKLKPNRTVKTVRFKGRKLIPNWAFVRPKKTRKNKSTPQL